MSEQRRVFLRYAAPSKGIREKTRGQRISIAGAVEYEYRSVYYFWFAFLKRNKEFEKIHVNDGKSKNKLHQKIYEDFGNIYDVVTADDFYKWFNQAVNIENKETRGCFLFAEETTSATQVVKDIAQLNNTENALLLKIDLKNTNAYIAKSIRDVLKQNANKVDRARKQSTARYKIAQKIPINTLYQSLSVYDFKKKNEKSGIKIENKDICEQCGIIVENFMGNVDLLKDGATQRERADNLRKYKIRCGKAVNRYEKQADKYIKSALSNNFLSNILSKSKFQ